MWKKLVAILSIFRSKAGHWTGTLCFWWHTGVYHNADLWRCFFKSIHQYENHHAITFTGYGSPLLRVQVQGTSVQWNAYQRVTLCPIKHNNGLPPVRVLFSQEEFNTFICRLYSKTLYDFNLSFFDYVFIITKVHMEAIIAHDIYWAKVQELRFLAIVHMRALLKNSQSMWFTRMTHQWE